MELCRMMRGLLLLGLLTILSSSEAAQDVSEENYDTGKPEPAADRDLVEALEVLLDQMNNHVPSTEKRGSIPLCGMGNRCAMKFGPRIGKLCDCGRGANSSCCLSSCCLRRSMCPLLTVLVEFCSM